MANSSELTLREGLFSPDHMMHRIACSVRESIDYNDDSQSQRSVQKSSVSNESVTARLRKMDIYKGRERVEAKVKEIQGTSKSQIEKLLVKRSKKLKSQIL